MKLALFDLDETLIHGDCATLWAEYMVKHGWVKDTQAFLAKEEKLMLDYANGGMDIYEYMSLTLEPLAGMTETAVSNEVSGFVEEVILPIVYPEAKSRLQHHREQGDRLVIISASGVHLVAPIAQALGVDECLAIDVEISDGRYTGKTIGTPTFREGKVTRLLELIEQEHGQLAEASFYSDSRNDLPLLKLVGNPFVINPDAHLQTHAGENGWPVLRWGQ